MRRRRESESDTGDFGVHGVCVFFCPPDWLPISSLPIGRAEHFFPTKTVRVTLTVAVPSHFSCVVITGPYTGNDFHDERLIPSMDAAPVFLLLFFHGFVFRALENRSRRGVYDVPPANYTSGHYLSSVGHTLGSSPSSGEHVV